VRRQRDARIVPIGDACDAFRSARSQVDEHAVSAARLPVEPSTPFPASALDPAVKARGGSLNPYQMTTADFDVAFITPVLAYAGQQADVRDRDVSSRLRAPRPTDFGLWRDYFAEHPAVLAVRVTPRQAAGFWTTVARGAAYTQGMVLPPMTHFKPGLARMRVLCGNAELTPIHAMTLDTRVSDTDAVREGLFVFAPDALAPSCPSVTLVLSSEKAPGKTDTRVLDASVLQRIWQDFAPWRDARSQAAAPGR